MKYQFIKATIDDLPYIVEVYNSIIPLGNVTADLFPVTTADWTPWFMQHQSPLRPIYILKIEDEVCGWMSFSDYKARTAYNITAEISIYLHENYRGKGLAFHFVELGLKELKTLGLKKVMAVIYADNVASIQLFKKLGFTQWGLLPEVCDVKGILKDVVILGKSM
jgi:L-amino acid N-acyltransferase YncA